jgi:hypothetical protein
MRQEEMDQGKFMVSTVCNAVRQCRSSTCRTVLAPVSENEHVQHSLVVQKLLGGGHSLLRAIQENSLDPMGCTRPSHFRVPLVTLSKLCSNNNVSLLKTCTSFINVCFLCPRTFAGPHDRSLRVKG